MDNEKTDMVTEEGTFSAETKSIAGVVVDACSGLVVNGDGDGWRARPPCPARGLEGFLFYAKEEHE